MTDDVNKVKTKNKTTKDFSKLFLAQELFISPSPSLPSDTSSIHSSSGASMHSNKGTEDSHTTKETKEEPRKKSAVWITKFSNDGRYLAVGGKDGIVRGTSPLPFSRS